jgi:type I restriction enzyme S subunit
MSLKTEVRMGITQREVAFGQDCKALIAAHGINRIFLFFAVAAQKDAILSMVDEAGHGTGRLSTDLLARLEILLPPPAEQQRIVDAIEPLSRGAARRQAEGFVLEEVRDTLLPKLVSGQLRIRDAERLVEEAV